jgi:hypothetical protein
VAGALVEEEAGGLEFGPEEVIFVLMFVVSSWVLIILVSGGRVVGNRDLT